MSHRRKNAKREMTVDSDDSYNERELKKQKSYHIEDKTYKSHKKHKKSSKQRTSEISSDSDGDYDSRKENKLIKKHKKKSSKDERYFDKSFDKHSKRAEETSKRKHYEADNKRERATSSDKYFEKSKKRSKSQERQRYGKWVQDADKNKDSRLNSKFQSSRVELDSDDNEKHHNSSDYNNRHSRREVSDKYKSSKQKYSENLEGDNRLQKFRDSKKDRYDRLDEEVERRRMPTNNIKDRNSTFGDNEEEKSYRKIPYKSHPFYQKENSSRRRPRDYVDLDEPKKDDEVDISKSSNLEKENPKKTVDDEPLSKRAKIGNINMRTGGAYIPPAKLRMMQEKIKDKSSEEYQRIAWEALKKSIVGMTNKVNSSNISDIIPDLFKENIIRGRGILARAIMQAQAASPTFTRVYAALVAIINTKFPEIGELILKRLIMQYKRGFRRNDKTICMTAARFLAHLLNQEVAHELLILEMVTHLLENPTEDSIEVAIAALKECGKKLTQLTSKGMRAITERVREVLHEGNVDTRIKYMIEVFFAIQKDGFKDFPVIPPELDLVEEEDKFTHFLNLDDAVDSQDMLNVFKFDPDYLENEEKYKSVVKEILGDSDDEGGESGNESGSEAEEEEEEAKAEENQQIIDMTETNVVCLRRKIYLTIQSSLDFEECAHKLLKLELKPGQILEMCYMILDCCAQQRTYEKFFGLLAQRFCQLNKVYVEPFTEIFENSYKTIHRLETNKLRNVAKFFAHLLYTDAISWTVLSIIKLNEEDTTSSSRIFIKILFQELCEYMGLPKLNERIKDVTLQEAFDGLFPRDHQHNTRFAVNFFTSIGLGGLTDELREHLKNLPKNPIIPVVPQDQASSSESESAHSSSSSSSSSTTTTTSSSSSSSSSESD